MRYLGVYLDKQLNFKEHVKTRYIKTGSALALIQNVANTQNGLSVKGCRQIIKAVVEPSLLYGSEVWWKGSTVNGQPRAVKGVHLLRHVDRALRAAHKVALPVYKTTPTPVIKYELEVSNAEAKAEELRYADSLRMGQLPRNHPLKGRTIVN